MRRRGVPIERHFNHTPLANFTLFIPYIFYTFNIYFEPSEVFSLVDIFWKKSNWKEPVNCNSSTFLKQRPAAVQKAVRIREGAIQTTRVFYSINGVFVLQICGGGFEPEEIQPRAENLQEHKHFVKELSSAEQCAVRMDTLEKCTHVCKVMY